MHNGQDPIVEIRERLVAIETNQTHQTKLLEKMSQQADNTFRKAEKAENEAKEAKVAAGEALRVAEQTSLAFEAYKEDEKVTKRWLVGLLVTIGLALLPIFSRLFSLY